MPSRRRSASLVALLVAPCAGLLLGVAGALSAGVACAGCDGGSNVDSGCGAAGIGASGCGCAGSAAGCACPTAADCATDCVNARSRTSRSAGDRVMPSLCRVAIMDAWLRVPSPTRAPWVAPRRTAARSCRGPSGSLRSQAAQSGRTDRRRAGTLAGPAARRRRCRTESDRDGDSISAAVRSTPPATRRVLRDLVPRDVEVHVRERGSSSIVSKQAAAWSCRPAGSTRPTPDVRPDDRRVRMAPKQRPSSAPGTRARRRAWQTACRCRCASARRGPTSPAKSKMRSSAGSVRLAVSPATFDDTNSLWIVNSPMPVNTPGNVVEHAPDVVGRVHVGRD